MRFSCSMLAAALAAAFSVASAATADRTQDLAHYVNPMIGTGGHGHTFPGPTLPFGMIQPGPDTRLTGWDGSSAYHDSDRVVYGFSHTHLSGTGVSDYGDVLLLPATGAVKWQSGYRFKGEDPLPFDPSGYGSLPEQSRIDAECWPSGSPQIAPSIFSLACRGDHRPGSVPANSCSVQRV
jgi:hypothetical protein